MKEGKYTGKNGNLMEPGEKNKNEMVKKDVEPYGEESGETGEPQQPIRQKYRKFRL